MRYISDECDVFVKQKTAYEMRISDGSSDVCSSDLGAIKRGGHQQRAHPRRDQGAERRGARRDEEEGRQIGAQRVDRDAADREDEGLGIARRIEQPSLPDDGKETRPQQDGTAQDQNDHHSYPLLAQKAAASGRKIQSIPAPTSLLSDPIGNEQCRNKGGNND